MNKGEDAASKEEQDVENAASAKEDLQLVERCQAGDANAYNALVTKYRSKVFAMTFHMVRSEEDAWDLTQEAFLKAWRSMKNFRRQSAFYTWLYRITMNVALDRLRRKKIESGVEFDDQIGLRNIEPASRTTPTGTISPIQGLEAEELRTKIDAAIAKLTPEHKQVIILREINGLEYNEIAEAVGCELGTVMSRLFYARRKLQTLLKDVYEAL